MTIMSEETKLNHEEVNLEDLEDGEIEDDEEDPPPAPAPPLKEEPPSTTTTTINNKPPPKESKKSLKRALDEDEEKHRILKEKLKMLERQMAGDTYYEDDEDPDLDEGEEDYTPEESGDDEEMGVYTAGGSPKRFKFEEDGCPPPVGKLLHGHPGRDRRNNPLNPGPPRRNQKGQMILKRGRGNANVRRNPRKKKSDEICKMFMQGKCQKTADSCLYSHDAVPPKMMELCKFYLFDRCAKRDKCLYLHKEFPCKYYHTGNKCVDSASDCKFSHEPLNDDTRGILLKHLESAPKEILGEFPRLTRDVAASVVFEIEAKNKGWLEEEDNSQKENEDDNEGGSKECHESDEGKSGGDSGLGRKKKSRWETGPEDNPSTGESKQNHFAAVPFPMNVPCNFPPGYDCPNFSDKFKSSDVQDFLKEQRDMKLKSETEFLNEKDDIKIKQTPVPASLPGKRPNQGFQQFKGGSNFQGRNNFNNGPGNNFNSGGPNFMGNNPNFNNNIPPNPNYNGPPQNQNFNGPPQNQNFNGPPNQNFHGPPNPNFNAPPNPSFNGPPNFNGPPQNQNFNGPPNQSFNGPPNQNFNGPPQNQNFNGPHNFNGPPNSNFNGHHGQNFNGPPNNPNNYGNGNNQHFNGGGFNGGGPPPGNFNGPRSHNNFNNGGPRFGGGDFRGNRGGRFNNRGNFRGGRGGPRGGNNNFNSNNSQRGGHYFEGHNNSQGWGNSQWNNSGGYNQYESDDSYYNKEDNYYENNEGEEALPEPVGRMNENITPVEASDPGDLEGPSSPSRSNRDPRARRDPRKRESPPPPVGGSVPVDEAEKERRILDLDISAFGDLEIPNLNNEDEEEEENELPFKGSMLEEHTSTQEIDASLLSRPLMDYALLPLSHTKPDYQDLLQKHHIPASQISQDPRLRRYSEKNTAVAASTSSSSSLQSKPSDVYNPKRDLIAQKYPVMPSGINESGAYSPSQDMQDMYGKRGGEPVYNPRKDYQQQSSNYGSSKPSGSNRNDPRMSRRDPRRRE